MARRLVWPIDGIGKSISRLSDPVATSASRSSARIFGSCPCNSLAWAEQVGDVALCEPVGGVVEVDEHEVLALSPPGVRRDGQTLVLGPEALAAVLELLPRAPALGGVDRDPDEAVEPSLGVPHPDDPAVGGEGAAVLAAQRELALELPPLGDLAAQLGRCGT